MLPKTSPTKIQIIYLFFLFLFKKKQGVKIYNTELQLKYNLHKLKTFFLIDFIMTTLL